MIVFYLFGILMFLLVVAFLISQIFIPLASRKTLFPIFSKEADLQEKIVSLSQELSEEELQDKIFELEKKLKEKKEARNKEQS